MTISFVNGARVQFTLHELLGFYRQRHSVTAMAGIWVALVFLKPFPALAELSLADQVVFWGMVFSGTFALFLAILTGLGRHLRLARSWVAHGLAATACALLSPELGIALGLERTDDPLRLFLVIMVFSMVCSMLAEFLTATYLLPGYLARLAGAPLAPAPGTPAPETTPPEQVVLLGKTFALPDLRVISAEEHYVRITTVHGRQMLRGRISDIEAQLPDALGLRVHRSYWVAASAVQALNRSREGWVLELTDGSTVPVARPRREAVRDWLETTGKA